MKKEKFSMENRPQFNGPFPFLTESILKQSFLVTYERNEKIVKQTIKPDYLYLLLEGKARILQQEPNGKSLILQFLEVGDFIGELTLRKRRRHLRM